MPMISGKTPQGGGVTPRCYGEGRLVLIFPREEYTGTAFDGKEPKQFMRCDVVALVDTHPAPFPNPSRPSTTITPPPPFITFGGEMDKDGVSMKTPDTMRVEVAGQGWMKEGVSFGGGLLFDLRRSQQAGQARVGRLFKDHQHNGTWKLTDVEDTSPEYAAAMAWSQAMAAQAFVNQVPQPIPVVPAQQPPATQQWGGQPQAQGWGAPQQQAPQGYPQQAPPQQGWGAPQGYPQQPQPQYAQQAPPPAAPQGWGPPPGAPQSAPPAPNGWQQHGQQVAQGYQDAAAVTQQGWAQQQPPAAPPQSQYGPWTGAQQGPGAADQAPTGF